MRGNNINNRLRWGVLGGFLGGLIALIGFWVFSVISLPPSDSDWLSMTYFLIPRIIVGSIVAMIVGPIIVNKFTKNKSKPNWF